MYDVNYNLSTIVKLSTYLNSGNFDMMEKIGYLYKNIKLFVNYCQKM